MATITPSRDGAGDPTDIRYDQCRDITKLSGWNYLILLSTSSCNYIENTARDFTEAIIINPAYLSLRKDHAGKTN